MHLMRIGLTAMMTAVLSMGIACAQEPVDPQPALRASLLPQGNAGCGQEDDGRRRGAH